MGRSMWPLLRAGDVLLIEPSSAPPAIGAVVVVRASGRLVAHRVIGRRDDGQLRLRGDFTRSEDVPAEPSAVVGQVVAIERAGRRRPLDGPAARLLAFALPPLERAAPQLLDGLRSGVVSA